LDVFSIFKDGGIKFPKTGTRGNDIRDRNRQKNTAVIRKRTRDNVTRRNRRNPNIRYTKQIDTRRTGTIPPGPDEAGIGGMKVPLNVNYTARVKKTLERGGTLTGQV